MCGIRLDEKPRRGLNIAWADLVLIIGVVAIGWVVWTRVWPRQLGFRQPALATIVALASPTPIPTPTMTPVVTPTAATTPITITVVPAASTPVIHTVASGESLGYIASLYGVRSSDLMAANNLDDPDRLSIGQKLMVPTPAPASSRSTVSPTPANDTLNYVVQKGDTLGDIAIRFKTTAAAIQKANRMGTSEMIRPAQVLLVPVPKANSRPAPTATPAPEPTSEYHWPAPFLLSPADKALIPTAGQPLLRWAASGVLDQDEWYVVRVWPEDEAWPAPPVYWTKGTSWRVGTEWRPPDTATGRRYFWQVTIVRGTGEEGDRQASKVSSPMSAVHSFIWGEALNVGEKAPE
jgi:LysM repeat protein